MSTGHIFSEEESEEPLPASRNGEQPAVAVASSTSDDEKHARLHAEHHGPALQEHEQSGEQAERDADADEADASIVRGQQPQMQTNQMQPAVLGLSGH